MAITAAIVVSTAVSVDAVNRSARAQKERGRISTASQKNIDAANLREQARQERIRRAQIQAAATNTGAGGSSKEGGAISSLSTQVDANVARVEGQQVAAAGISKQNQKIADAQVQQAFGQAITTLASSKDTQDVFKSLFD